MPDKEIIQAVLDAVGVAHGKENRERHGCEEECAVPEKILYFIFTNCVTINNGACEDWKFCQPCHKD